MRGENDRHPPDHEPALPVGAQRIDKWLWFARMAKSRTLAAQLVAEGKVRINRAKAAKPAQSVRPNDVLTIAMRGQVQVLRILAPGVRRGPPAEARLLYELLVSGSSAPAAADHPAPNARRPSRRGGRVLRRIADDR